jgi:3-hydroxyisobutyrate dehydrogenase
VTRIGFAGLGRMGAAMASRFIDAGYQVTVWNRTAAKAQPLVALGARQAATPHELASQSDIVISMLGDDRSVHDLYMGAQGFLSGEVAGKLFIDMTTVRPDTARGLGAAAVSRGACFIDAPVSGTVAPAKAGQLLALVGASQADLTRARPLLDVLCRRIVHAGPVGQGALLKYAVNLPLAIYWQALAEACALAVRGGLDLKLVLETIADSSAALAVLKLKTPAILGEPGPVAFDVASMQKDVLGMLETGGRLGVPMPAASAALGTYAAAADHALASEDAVAIVRFVEQQLCRDPKDS